MKLLLALLCLVLGAPATAQDANGLRPVITEIVSPHAGLASSWVGNVAAPSEIDLAFLRLGTLAERLVDVASVVKKGDVLARLDATDLEAELRSAKAGVSIAEAGFNTAQDAYDRATTLADRGVNSASALEDTTNSLASARASLEQARAAEARAEDARDFANLRAPLDGVITLVDAEVGARLTAGETVMTLASTDGREVLIALSEEDATAMTANTTFQIKLLSNPDVTSTATLKRIDSLTTRATRTRSAHLALSNDAPPAFRLGALVNVSLSRGQRAITTLPVSALIAQSEPPQVWRVSPEERKVSRVTVAIGPTGGGRVVVLSGISEGDEIVTRGVNSIDAGQSVGPRMMLREMPGGMQ